MDLLTEKYRPKTFENVIGNLDTIESIQLITKTRQLPHLLFTGPPGTGKTTCAKIIAKEILKSKKNYILELNASDERGIDIVREKIKHHASKKVNLEANEYKLIILDEADSMTIAAQQALRRVMETASDTRFILICNTFSKIFEPIQSRCAVLRFDRIEQSVITQKLMEITNSEKINITKNALETIVNLCDGDMRQSLNILQSCLLIEGEIEDTVILKIVGLPSPKIIDQILKLLLDKKLEEALTQFEIIWNEKYDPADIINSFFRSAKNMDSYELLKHIGYTNLRITQGCNTKLQFYRLIYEIINIQ